MTGRRASLLRLDAALQPGVGARATVDADLPQPGFRVPPRRAGFTLVELLAAMAVVSLLLAFAVPMFSRLGSPAERQRAGELVASGVSEARTLALAQARRTALVVQDKAGRETHQWRRYAVFVEEFDGSGNPHWVAEGNWRTLPEGILFASQANGLAPATSLLDTVDKIEVPVDLDRRETLPALIFGPRGSVQPSDELADLPADERRQALSFWISDGVVVNGRVQQRGREPRPLGLRVHELTGATQQVLPADRP